MPPRILFYISGHGFGHARRSCRIIEALQRRRPDLQLNVRSNAPRSIFHTIGLADTQIRNSTLDFTIVEKDAFTIDDQATAAGALQFCRQSQQTIAVEVESVKKVSPNLIVTDISFLAGEVASRLRIPCIASGNFTWDWICDPMLRGRPGGADALAIMTNGYARMTGILRHSFAHPMPPFPWVREINPVAYPARDRQEIDCLMNLPSIASQPRILLAMRGGISETTLLAGVSSCLDFSFSTLTELPSGAPANLYCLQPNGLDFAEVMAAHDVVISKLGSGIVCDAIAAKTRLLWPRRTGFREDELFNPGASDVLNLQEIPRSDYVAGNWRAAIEQLLRQPLSPRVMPTDGADQAAESILKFA